MDLPHPVIAPPMHALRLRRKVLQQIYATTQPLTDSPGGQHLTVPRDRLPRGIGKIVAFGE